MTDLFTIAPAQPDSLSAARSRYAAAVAAYEQADTDETSQLGRALFEARAELDAMERLALNNQFTTNRMGRDTVQAVSEPTQSGPYPARAEKVMESAHTVRPNITGAASPHGEPGSTGIVLTALAALPIAAFAGYALGTVLAGI